MPPCRTSPRNTSANGFQVDSGPVSAPSTPKRAIHTSYSHQNSIAPGDASPSYIEVGTSFESRDAKQAKAKAEAEEETTLDEIVVSNTPQAANIKRVSPDHSQHAATMESAVESPRVLRRSSRAVSISQNGSSALSPPGRGVTIKKQDDVAETTAEDDGKPDELSDAPASKKRKVDSKPAKRIAIRKSRSKWDNHDEMLTDPNSPLVKAKLRELLCSPRAWDILTAEEREQILGKFPDNVEILDPGTPNARPDIAALRNNNNFRHDVARYQEGLSKGFHDPEWVQQAQAAHRSRELGFYDDFMAVDFEERWDMPMPQMGRDETKANEHGDHQPARALEEPANDASIEAKTALSSEDVTDHTPRTNSPAQPQADDIPYKEPTEVNLQDQNGSSKVTSDDEIAVADSITVAEAAEDNATSVP
ncbi:Asx homology domain-containing protein [Nemania sp. NC0429]|nr:Asx homology domain-containing protein [Nemania sp. NC0429]